LIRSFLIKSALRGGPRDLTLQIGLIRYNKYSVMVVYLSELVLDKGIKCEQGNS
jgi:hypothetical protein